MRFRSLIPSRLLQTNKYNKVKLDPCKCGIEPMTDARDRYSIRYYLVAMLFGIFDVETVFMVPWAVIREKLGVFGLIEMGTRRFILGGGGKSGGAGEEGNAGGHALEDDRELGSVRFPGREPSKAWHSVGEAIRGRSPS